MTKMNNKNKINGMKKEDNEIKGIILDVGGVILNLEEVNKKTREYLERFFPSIKYKDYMKRLRPYKDKAQTKPNYSLKDAIFDTLKSYNNKNTNIKEEYIKRFYESIMKVKPTLSKNTLPTLKALKEKRLKICLLSDTHYNNKEAVEFFNKLNRDLLKYVDCTILSKEVGLKKPNRKLFDYTIRKIGLKPNNLIFITDSNDEVIGANKYGFKYVVLVNTEKDSKKSMHRDEIEDYKINDLKEILKIT